MTEREYRERLREYNGQGSFVAKMGCKGEISQDLLKQVDLEEKEIAELKEKS